jgi:hypothetical protein
MDGAARCAEAPHTLVLAALLSLLLYMSKTIAGFFRTRADGETAQDKLLAGGFTRDEVSFVAGDTGGHEMPVLGPLRGTGAESEVAQDAYIGGAIGVTLGVIAVMIPGFGLLIAAGPLAMAIGGLSMGAAAGGIVGLLREHGISEDEAGFYSEGVRRGGALITVHGVTEDGEKKARKIMKQSGAIDTEELADEEDAPAVAEISAPE